MLSTLAIDDDDLLRTLRAMLPTSVCVAAGSAHPISLTAKEFASLGTVTAERLCEFKSGRAYAKRALAMLGIPEADLPIAPDRSPSWPRGIVGSITHTSDDHRNLYAAAAVARSDTVLALGIDFEIADGLDPHMWPYILTSGELERLLTMPNRERRTQALLIWCAKEATIKLAKRPFDPYQLEISHDSGNGRFVANFVTEAGCLRASIFGRTARSGGISIATAVQLPALNRFT